MSSLLVYAQPATGRPASFIPLSAPALLERLSSAHVSRITAASRLEMRPAPELAGSGIPPVDVLTGGLPRGCLTEIYGLPSSGRTSVLLSVIAAASHRREACALVDVSNALDPHAAAAAGVDLQQLLWVRCNTAKAKKNPPQRYKGTEKSHTKSDMARMAQALKVTDLLVQSGGFGLIAIDLSDLGHATSRRIPLASWFRFRRAVENTPTVLLLITQAPCARTCASLLLHLHREASVIGRESSAGSQPLTPRLELSRLAGLDKRITVHNFPKRSELLGCVTPAHSRLLEGISIRVEVERSRLDRKPVQSDKTAIQTRAVWCI